MGDLQIKKQPKQYDAVIVGSGAGGGMAAYVLSKEGLSVCLVEAGDMYDPQKNITQLKNPWDSPRRGASTKFRPFGDFDACYYGWDIESLSQKQKVPNGIGGVQECSAEEPTIGEEYRCVLDQKILKEKVSMVWAMIGPSVMKI
jgi:choline dehydrogenase-like flavoprotein